MRIVNVHRRTYDAPAERVGRLVDSLGSGDDRLWPGSRWPRMVLRPGLAPGAEGGHGPIRYDVVAHDPSRHVVFRFRRPRGWTGTHAFTVEPAGDRRATLSHALEMEARGAGLLAWLVVLRPLRDALLEDALDRAVAELGGAPPPPRPWSFYVRLLRWLLRPRRRAPRRTGTPVPGSGPADG